MVDSAYPVHSFVHTTRGGWLLAIDSVQIPATRVEIIYVKQLKPKFKIIKPSSSKLARLIIPS